MKKSWKLGFLRTFKIWNFDFFPFSSNIFSPFRVFQRKCDSYGIHIILLFVENIITNKMPIKNLEKILKIDNFIPNLKNLFVAPHNYILWIVGLFDVCFFHCGFLVPGNNLATLHKNRPTLFVLEVRKYLHWIPLPRKYGFSIKNHGSRLIRTYSIIKVSNVAKIWQPCLKIWQPCLFYRFENSSIGFLVLENMVLALKTWF